VYLGATLDWYADVLVNIAQIVWWQQVEPVTALYFGWTFLFAELAVMLLDSIFYVQGRYPVLGGNVRRAELRKPSGGVLPGTTKPKQIPWLLSLSLCEGSHGSTYRYTNFYAVIWMSFPLALSSICVQLGYHYNLPLSIHDLLQREAVEAIVAGWLYLCWTVGVALSAAFIATEMQMAWFLLTSWFERRDRSLPSKVIAVYDTTQTSLYGGCVFFPYVETWPVASVGMTYGRQFAIEALAKELTVDRHPVGALVRATVAQLLQCPQKAHRIKKIYRIRSHEELRDIFSSAFTTKGRSAAPNSSPSKTWAFTSEHIVIITNAAEVPFEHLHVPLDAQALQKDGSRPSTPPSSTPLQAAAPVPTTTPQPPFMEFGAVMSPHIACSDTSSFHAIHIYKGTPVRVKKVLGEDGGEDERCGEATPATTIVVVVSIDGEL
jgi:hypothetical protein